MRKLIEKIVLPLLGLMCSAAPLSARADAQCPQQSVFGYYAGYYAWHPDYQAPRHVDMTAMTHLIFAQNGNSLTLKGVSWADIPSGGMIEFGMCGQ